MPYFTDNFSSINTALGLNQKAIQEEEDPKNTTRNLSPGRVAQSILPLFTVIVTPATSPKPRGKSPGWKQGEKIRKRKTYPIAKKSYSHPKKAKKEAA